MCIDCCDMVCVLSVDSSVALQAYPPTLSTVPRPGAASSLECRFSSRR